MSPANSHRGRPAQHTQIFHHERQMALASAAALVARHNSEAQQVIARPGQTSACGHQRYLPECHVSLHWLPGLSLRIWLLLFACSHSSPDHSSSLGMSLLLSRQRRTAQLSNPQSQRCGRRFGPGCRTKYRRFPDPILRLDQKATPKLASLYTSSHPAARRVRGTNRDIYQLKPVGVPHEVICKDGRSLQASIGPSAAIGISNVEPCYSDSLDLVGGFGHLPLDRLFVLVREY